ncbi:MAG TPA: hypothetical protein VE954_18965 [Oligoflexus sp.]|uniref:hypothetical protein n=1 Tax=Oligoflexus sp. TaxID=1971216 RepID=UPI002D2D5963|nr:hypothetical protein [Oligoflexus sp.]HYX35182.1 hypothetical protein [Oligoflexus sp.]
MKKTTLGLVGSIASLFCTWAVQAASIGPATTGLPNLSQLQALNIDPNDLGHSMFISNNPETVTNYGVVASADGFSGNPQRGDTASYPYTASAPNSSMQVIDWTNTCWQMGSTSPFLTKKIEVYIAHIMAVNGYISFGLTGTKGTRVKVKGHLRSGPWNTRSPNFVSAEVSRSFYFGNPDERIITLGDGYTQVEAVPGANSYIDGRLSIEVIDTGFDSCVTPIVLAQPQAATWAGQPVPSQVAKGNVAWINWFKGVGHGRAMGVYSASKIAATENFSLPGPYYYRGYRIASEEQSIAADRFASDSANDNFGNYGTLYDLKFNITNSGSTCMSVRPEIVSYAGLKGNQAPTYGVYNAIKEDLPSIYWNGPVSIGVDNSTPFLDHIVLYAQKDFSKSENAMMQTSRDGIGQSLITINPGQTRSVQLRMSVPGLISAPAAAVFTSEVCP